jgi:hypothetical protein
MPLATKNNAIILKDGLLAENCGCCGGWYCYDNPCAVDLAIPAWTCGGNNEELPPDFITARVQYSGESLSYYVVARSDDRGNVSTIRVRTQKADTSLSADFRLDRIPFTYIVDGPTIYGCAYQGRFQGSQGPLITIWPGVRSGGGWGAAINFNFSVFDAVLMSVTLGEIVPANDAPPCGTQSEPPEASGSATNTSVGIVSDASGGFSRPDGSGWSYSTNGPFFAPNPTLAGLSWSYSMASDTLCRRTDGFPGLRIFPTPRKRALTITVVENQGA